MIDEGRELIEIEPAGYAGREQLRGGHIPGLMA
jgi:hypothetical protein